MLENPQMLDSWLEAPVIVIAVLAVLGLLWKAAVWKGKVDSDLPYLKSMMEEIRDDIKNIFQALPMPTAVGKSPTQLTEFGEKIANRIEVWEWASQEAESLLDDETLVGMEPFQIEAFREGYIDSGFQHQGTVQDKMNMAIYEFGIDRDRALPVLRIPLREALLKRQARLQQPASC